MKIGKITHKICLLFFLFFSIFCFSQSNKQKELEARRVKLRQEITQINKLLSKNKSKKKSEISAIENLNHKIRTRRNLIKVTNQQANLLRREINNNQKRIITLKSDLITLRNNYAEMIRMSYKNKNEQSRIMFLLSSNDFKQAYKRIQYINQYTNYQKQQGALIKNKTTDLEQLNKKLLVQKGEKQKLIKENKGAQKKLEIELKEHKGLMVSIQKNLSKYASQIKAKQREANKINKQIQAIIREAIRKSNEKAGKVKSEGFALTSEAKALAKSFLASKGKLPWPVEKGVVILRYGTQQHPIVKTVKIQSNGVRIATEVGSKVRAVFKGKVLSVQSMKRGNLTILIQHGNYITAYKNLGKVYVKKGDKVTTKQSIGEVFTNPSNNETILSFSVFKESTTQNPAYWIYRM